MGRRGFDSSRGKGNDEILNDLNGEKASLDRARSKFHLARQHKHQCSVHQAGRLIGKCHLFSSFLLLAQWRHRHGDVECPGSNSHSALTGAWQPAAQNMKPRFQSPCAPVQQSISEDNHDLVFVLGDSAITSRFSPTWRQSGGHWHGTRVTARDGYWQLVTSPFH